MGLNASRPKYHISAMNGGGPDGTDWWKHSDRAVDRDHAIHYKRYYKEKYPHITIVLTPESGPFGVFTRFPTGYRHWAYTDNFSFVTDLSDMPKTNTRRLA